MIFDYGKLRFGLSDEAATRLIQSVGALAMLMSIAAFAFYTFNDRARSLEEMRVDARRNADLAATLVDQFVNEANSLAEGYQTATRLAILPFNEFVDQSTPWLNEVVEGHNSIGAFSVLDDDGVALASTVPTFVGQHFGFRAYYFVHLNPDFETPYIAEPILARETFNRISVASWPLYARSGRLAGVLAFALNVTRLEEILDQVEDNAVETISIVMQSGKFVAAIKQGGAQSLPADYREPLFEGLVEQVVDSGRHRELVRSGKLWGGEATWQLVGRPLESFPGAVVVSRDHASAIGPWKKRVLMGSGVVSILLLLEAGIAFLLCDMIRARASELEATSQAAATDPLTGLYNRRVFDERAEAEWSRMAREGQPLALIVFDLDHFKSINDTYGHDGGDAVLMAVAERARATGRREDLVARIGGEEFAMLLPKMQDGAIEAFADRLVRSIEAMEVYHNGKRIPVTASAGICLPDVQTVTIRQAMRFADEALYEAKRTGRNRAVLSELGRRSARKPHIAA